MIALTENFHQDRSFATSTLKFSSVFHNSLCLKFTACQCIRHLCIFHEGIFESMRILDIYLAPAHPLRVRRAGGCVQCSKVRKLTDDDAVNVAFKKPTMVTFS